MTKTGFLITAIWTLLATAPVLASDIYKWTDAEGNVHYGDTPVDVQAERLAIASKRTDPASVQAMVQARSEARAAEAEAQAAAAEAGPSDEELQAEAAERAQKCSILRERLQKFINSRRLYREDEAGERTYLDDTQILAARERVEKQISDNCN